jgi:ribosomal protein L11 methyltransferase
MEYIELNIELEPRDPWAEILIADLADAGYESFVETEKGIQAYAKVSDIDPGFPLKNTLLGEEHPDFKVDVRVRIIPHENWNAKWEEDFEPVFVDEYCTIIAPFHDPSIVKGMTVVIQPQMSFGTGHHQTTYLMTKALFEMDKVPTTVLDMGTGTGVLAIVAEKLGAEEIVAVDIEDWSVENTMENAERNGCRGIRGLCGDIDVVPNLHYGLILANINKNVLKAHMSDYSKFLADQGVLLLSGFFNSDMNEITNSADQNGLKLTGKQSKDEWCCLKFLKEN